MFYQILFGLHPYVVTPKDIQDDSSSEISQNIARNLFPFGENTDQILNYPEPHNRFTKLPMSIQTLFKDAFSSLPHKRPNAEMWGKTIYSEVINCPPIPTPPMPKPVVPKKPIPSNPSNNVETPSVPIVDDKASFVLYFFSLLIPIIGWIIGGAVKDDFPNKAKAVNTCAWINLGINIIFFIIGVSAS